MFCLAIQTIDNLLTRYADGRLHKGVSIAKVKKMTRCMRLLENVSTIVKAGVIMGTLAFYHKHRFFIGSILTISYSAVDNE